MSLFEEPIKIKKVRNGVYARKYINGTIIIGSERYILHSMSSAIKHFRKNFPKYERI